MINKITMQKIKILRIGYIWERIFSPADSTPRLQNVSIIYAYRTARGRAIGHQVTHIAKLANSDIKRENSLLAQKPNVGTGQRLSTAGRNALERTKRTF